MKGVIRYAADGSLAGQFKSIADAAKESDTTAFFVKNSISSGKAVNGFTFRQVPDKVAQAVTADAMPQDAKEKGSAAGPSVHMDADATQPVRIVGEKPTPYQQEQPAADRLSQALKNFGLGVVTMQEHDTPVPFGHFWVTAMCQAAEKLPRNFVDAAATKTDVQRTAFHTGLPIDKVMVTFHSGPYRGTWIHRDLAFALALYCDSDGERGVRATVSRALAAMADGHGVRMEARLAQDDAQRASILAAERALVEEREASEARMHHRRIEHEALLAVAKVAGEARVAAAKAEGEAVVERARAAAAASAANTRRIRGLAVTELSSLPPRSFSLCEAADRAAKMQGTSERNMKMAVSSVKRPTTQGQSLDMWYWIPLELSLDPIKASDGTVYKQIKKTKYKVEEVSRYPDTSLNIVVGKMCAIFNANKHWVFARK